jgi:imidazolonepropionase
MSSADIRALKKAGVVPVVLSGTSFFLGGKKYAPAREMWDAGLPVALATDFNPGTNPSWNFPLVGSLAAIQQGLHLDEVLIAQTKHAALALGLKDRGVVAKGFRADLVALSLHRFEEMYYHYGTRNVQAVFVGGKKVL